MSGAEQHRSLVYTPLRTCHSSRRSSWQRGPSPPALGEALQDFDSGWNHRLCKKKNAFKELQGSSIAYLLVSDMSTCLNACIKFGGWGGWRVLQWLYFILIWFVGLGSEGIYTVVVLLWYTIKSLYSTYMIWGLEGGMYWSSFTVTLHTCMVWGLGR